MQRRAFKKLVARVAICAYRRDTPTVTYISTFLSCTSSYHRCSKFLCSLMLPIHIFSPVWACGRRTNDRPNFVLTLLSSTDLRRRNLARWRTQSSFIPCLRMWGAAGVALQVAHQKHQIRVKINNGTSNSSSVFPAFLLPPRSVFVSTALTETVSASRLHSRPVERMNKSATFSQSLSWTALSPDWLSARPLLPDLPVPSQ